MLKLVCPRCAVDAWSALAAPVDAYELCLIHSVADEMRSMLRHAARTLGRWRRS